MINVSQYYVLILKRYIPNITIFATIKLDFYNGYLDFIIIKFIRNRSSIID